MVHDDEDVNILSLCIHTIQKNTEDVVVANKQTGLQLNAEYMVMSRDQQAGQNNNIKICNKPSERVKQFKYLGTKLPNQNCIHEKLKAD